MSTPKPKFATPEELEALTSATAEGGAVYSPKNLAETYSRIRALPKGELRDMEMKKWKAITSAAKAERTKATKTAYKEGATPEQKAEIKGTFKSPAQPPERTPFQAALNAVDAVFDEPARRLISTVSGVKGDVYKDSGTFHPAMEKAARGGNTGAKAFEGAKAAAPGYAVGTLLGAIPQLRGLKGAMQLGGAAAGVFYDQLQKDDSPSLSDLVTGKAGAGGEAEASTWTKTKRLGADVVFSPLNAIKTVGPIEAATRNVEDLLKGAGKATDTAAQLVKDTLGTSLQPSSYKKLEAALTAAGVSPDNIAKTFGRSGQYLGSSEVGVGLGSAVKSVTPGYKIQKAIDAPFAAIQAGQARAALPTAATASRGTKLANAVANALPATEQLPLERMAAKRAMKASRRESRAISEQLRGEILTDARGVAALVKTLQPGEYEQVVARVLDPGIADTAGSFAASPAQQQVAQALTDFFGKHEKTLVEMGVPLGRNPAGLSPTFTGPRAPGAYYPRNFGIPTEGDDDLLAKLIERTQKATAQHGVPAPNLKPRTGDVAWGDVKGPSGAPTAKGADVALKSELARKGPDFAKDMASYGRQLSEAKGYDHLLTQLTAEFGDKATGKLTPQASEFLTRSFNDMATSIEKRADRLLYPDSSQGWMASAGRNALEALDTFQRAFKVNNLIWRVPYHITNVFGDGTLMAAHGINPAIAVSEALSLASRARRGDADALKLMQEANANNIGTLFDSAQRMEFPGATRTSQEANELSKLAGGRLSPGAEALYAVKSVGDKVPGFRQLTGITKQWEMYSKLGVYLDSLKKGMSPQQAAQRAYDVLIDYQGTTGQTGLAAGVQKAVLFYNYLTQAAKSASIAAVTHPAAFMAADKVSRNMSAETTTPAPEYLRETGTPLALGSGAKSLLSTARQATGGSEYAGDTYVNPRFGAYDALGLPLTLAGMASGIARGGTPVLPQELSKLGRFLEPNTKFAMESLTGIDTLTGGPKRPGVELTSPPAFQPAERYAREVLAPAFIPSPAQVAINIASKALGGPDQAIGRSDAVASRPGNKLFDQILSQTSPWRPIEATPTGAFYDQLNSPETAQFKAVSDYVKKTAEERRAVFRRKKKTP